MAKLNEILDGKEDIFLPEGVDLQKNTLNESQQHQLQVVLTVFRSLFAPKVSTG